MDLIETLLAQDGLVRRDQAIACGLSTTTIDRRLAGGDWLLVHPRVYRMADRPMPPQARLRGAALWAGDDAVLIGAAALARWRMVDEVPAVIEFAVGTSGGHTAPPGIRLVRRDVPLAMRSRVEGQWTLQRAPAVLEAAAVMSRSDGARLVDRALQTRKVSVEGLRAALSWFGERHGVVAARRLVELAAGGARSEAERTLIRELRSGGVRGGVPNLPVTVPGWGSAELDLAFPDVALAIEVDGWAFHRDVDRFRGDARRQNALVAAGWRVLRFTWYDLVEDPVAVVAAVAAALAPAA